MSETDPTVRDNADSDTLPTSGQTAETTPLPEHCVVLRGPAKKQPWKAVAMADCELPIPGSNFGRYLFEVGQLPDGDVSETFFVAICSAEYAVVMGILHNLACGNADILPEPGFHEDLDPLAQDFENLIRQSGGALVRTLPALLEVREKSFALLGKKYYLVNRPTAHLTAIDFAHRANLAIRRGNKGIWDKGLILAPEDLFALTGEIVLEARRLAATMSSGHEASRTTNLPKSLAFQEPPAAADSARKEDETAYRPASEFIDDDRFSDIKAINKALDDNPSIRWRRPKNKQGEEIWNRKEIHAVDWHKFRIQKPAVDPLDMSYEEVTNAVLAVNERKEEIDKAKRKGRK